MSIARQWRKEHGSDVSTSPVTKRRELRPHELRPDEWATSERRSSPGVGVSASDKIIRGVLNMTGPVDVTGATNLLAKGAKREVTFRKDVSVHVAPDNTFNHSRPLDELDKTIVGAYDRGRTVTTLLNGLDIVELEDGRSVLARLGEDCELLTRWHKFVDWLLGRRP